MSRLSRLAIAAGIAGTAVALASATPAAAFAPSVPAPSSDLPAPNSTTHATPASFNVSTTVTLDGCGGLLGQMPQANSITDFTVKSASGDTLSVPEQTLTTEPPANNSGQKIWAVHAPVSVRPSDPNGPYTMSATTQAKDSGSCPLGIPLNPHTVSTTSGTTTIRLAVPPQKPAKPTATPDTKARTVTLNWGLNHEPDVIAYYVYRRVPGGGFPNTPIAVVGQPQASGGHPATTASFVDDKLPSTGGDYSYVIAVSRAGASGKVAIDASDLVLAAAVSDAGVAAGIPADQAAPPPGSVPSIPIVVTPAGGTKPVGIGPLPVIPRLNAPGSPGSKTPSLLPTTTLADGTFQPTLPFDPEPGAANAVPPNSVQLPTGGENGSGGRPIIFYVAAALLALAVAMHLLWLRREVGKVPADGLVPVAPEGDPDGTVGAASQAPAAEAAGASTGLRRFIPARLPGLSGLGALGAKLPRRRRAEDAEAEIDQWLRDDSTPADAHVGAFFPTADDVDEVDEDVEPDDAVQVVGPVHDDTDVRDAEVDGELDGDDEFDEDAADPEDLDAGVAPAPSGPIVVSRGNGNGNGSGNGSGSAPPGDDAFAPPPAKRKLVVSIGGPRGR